MQLQLQRALALAVNSKLNALAGAHAAASYSARWAGARHIFPGPRRAEAERAHMHMHKHVHRYPDIDIDPMVLWPFYLSFNSS
jgi:hypothetical protein